MRVNMEEILRWLESSEKAGVREINAIAIASKRNSSLIRTMVVFTLREDVLTRSVRSTFEDNDD